MPREVISEEEKRKLASLEIKKAFGGVSDAEAQEAAELRKRKKLQEAIDKNNS